MEVTSMNSLSLPRPESNNIQVPFTERNDLPVNTDAKASVDLNEVMMDLEDMKNFLFMLIGAGSTNGSSDETKGTKINMVA